MLELFPGLFMPICRNCGSRLTKFDNDICPICGTKSPLKGTISETIEITSEISSLPNEFKDYQPFKRKICVILSFLFGFLGIPFFYIKRLKLAIFTFFVSIILISGLFLILFLVAKSSLLMSILFSILLLLIINALVGIVFLRNHEIKDGRGDFLV